jgi:hypothetical protein
LMTFFCSWAWSRKGKAFAASWAVPSAWVKAYPSQYICLGYFDPVWMDRGEWNIHFARLARQLMLRRHCSSHRRPMALWFDVVWWQHRLASKGVYRLLFESKMCQVHYLYFWKDASLIRLVVVSWFQFARNFRAAPLAWNFAWLQGECILTHSNDL